jgi:cadmium resistance protein CadD (predicted permease)
MIDILTIITVTAGAFIGTNLDNLVLLVAFYSRYGQHPDMVSGGYSSGMLIIGATSYIIGVTGGFIPVNYLGFLGLIPMLMGLRALLQLFRRSQDGDPDCAAIEDNRRAVFITVLATQLSNGADSIITFSVLMAESTSASDYLIVLTFVAMIAVFSRLAMFSLKHRKLSDVLEKYGPYVTPFILIGVGLYIFANTASDLVAG